jgi:hypothetical protein
MPHLHGLGGMMIDLRLQLQLWLRLRLRLVVILRLLYEGGRNNDLRIRNRIGVVLLVRIWIEVGRARLALPWRGK